MPFLGISFHILQNRYLSWVLLPDVPVLAVLADQEETTSGEQKLEGESKRQVVECLSWQGLPCPSPQTGDQTAEPCSRSWESRPWQVVASGVALLGLRMVIFSLWPPKVNMLSHWHLCALRRMETLVVLSSWTHPNDLLLRPCLQILSHLGIGGFNKCNLKEPV